MASATASAKCSEPALDVHGWICFILMLIMVLSTMILTFPTRRLMGCPAFFFGLASVIVVIFYGFNTRKKLTTYIVLIAGITLTAISGSYFMRLTDHSLTQCFVQNDGLVWDGCGGGRFAAPIVNRCVVFSQYANQRVEIGGHTYEIHCHIAKTKGSILYHRLGENYEKVEGVLKPVADSFTESITVSQMERRARQALNEAGLSDLVLFQHVTVWSSPNIPGS